MRQQYLALSLPHCRFVRHAVLFSLLVLVIAPTKATAKQTDPIAGLIGQVVYQRPNGIYVQTIGNPSANRIAAQGTKPRWSPDGKKIAFFQGNAVMLYSLQKNRSKQVAMAASPQALSFSSNGKALYFSDGKLLQKVTLKNGKLTTVYEGTPFLEIDTAGKGKRLAVTTKTFTGFRVEAIDLTNGTRRTVSKGCSASLSPGGKWITVNGPKHRSLFFYDWQNLQRVGRVSGPNNRRFDNQQWSNHPLWLASTTEGKAKDIFLHHAPSNSAYQITSSGDCDRADLFVSRSKD